jgi:uroporphyrinogen-III synthase
MRILITRPLDDARETAAKLKSLGHEAIIAPLLEIRFRDGAEINLENVQAILATSANGVRALARRTARRDIPVFAVGPQTSEAARLAGFAAVKSADGDADALVVATAKLAQPDAGALFHAQGEQRTGGLAKSLAARGFEIRSEVLYEAVAAPALPQQAIDALQTGALDAVFHFSPRSARVFAECLARAGLMHTTQMLAALCISRAAADALAPLKFREIRIAARPDQEAMFALASGGL